MELQSMNIFDGDSSTTVKWLKGMSKDEFIKYVSSNATPGSGAQCLVCGRKFQKGAYYLEDDRDAGCCTCINCADEKLVIDGKGIVIRKAV